MSIWFVGLARDPHSSGKKKKKKAETFTDSFHLWWLNFWDITDIKTLGKYFKRVTKSKLIS